MKPPSRAAREMSFSSTSTRGRMREKSPPMSACRGSMVSQRPCQRRLRRTVSATSSLWCPEPLCEAVLLGGLEQAFSPPSRAQEAGGEAAVQFSRRRRRIAAHGQKRHSQVGAGLLQVCHGRGRRRRGLRPHVAGCHLVGLLSPGTAHDQQVEQHEAVLAARETHQDSILVFDEAEPAHSFRNRSVQVEDRPLEPAEVVGVTGHLCSVFVRPRPGIGCLVLAQREGYYPSPPQGRTPWGDARVAKGSRL